MIDLYEQRMKWYQGFGKGSKLKSNTQKNSEMLKRTAFKNRLNSQFAVVMTLLITLSVSISGTLNYSIERHSVIEKAREANALAAMNLSEQVISYVDNTVNTMRTTLNAMNLKSMDQSNQEMTFINILNHNTHIKGLTLYDLKGEPLIATKKIKQTRSENREALWFKHAADGFVYLSDVYIDTDTGLAMVTISQPVDDLFEGRVGVVSYDLRMDKFKQVIDNIQLGDTGHAYIVDKVGSLMVHRDYESKVLAEVEMAKVKGVQNVMGSETYDRILKNSEDKELDYTKALFSEIYTDYDGKKVIGGYAKIPELQWGIVVEQSYESVLGASKASFNRLIKSMMVFVVLGLLISVVVARSFTKPIIRMVYVADKIKDGDLTERIDTCLKSELGSLQGAINEMANSLMHLINRIGSSSSMIKDLSEELNSHVYATSESSDHISQIIEKVANGTQEQIESITTGSSAIHEMATNLRSATDNLNEITEASKHTSELAQSGAENIEKIIAVMRSINGIFTRSSKLVKQLDHGVEEIGGIVNYIKGISDQTNLLALNASIEAARAGEHGRGFTVVANEVKNLADQSAKATEEISTLIGKIQTDTGHIVTSMSVSMEEVQEETKVITQTADSFMVIINETKKVAKEVDTFSGSMGELTAGMDLIENAIQAIFQVSDANAAESQNVLASVEEQLAAIQHIKESIETLNDMALQLETVVHQFQLMNV